MASGISIVVRGAKELANDLADGNLLDKLLRPGFEQASIIVEGAARGTVHRVTGKLQTSLGHTIQGHGRDIEAHVGPQPGLGQPRRYTAGDSAAWQKPRSGTNRGDPTEYGVFEEQGTRYRPGHPFLEPSLLANIDRIENVIQDEADRGIGTLGRHR